MYRILVVDDEKIERNGIKFLLGQMDVSLTVLEAANGKQALEVLEKEPVDILLTDIKMPFIDGMELIESVHGKYPEMLKIIFSGFGDFEYAKTAIKYGVQDYILKPVEPEEFKATLTKVFNAIKEQEANKQYRDMSQAFFEDHILYSLVNGGSSQELLKRHGNVLDMGAVCDYRQMILLEYDMDFFGKKDENLFDVLTGILGKEIRYLNLNPQQSVVFLKKELKETGRSVCEELYSSLYTTYHYVCHIVLSDVCESMESYGSAMEAMEGVMENKFFQTESHVFLVEENKASFAVQMDDDILFKQMKQDIKMKDIAALKNHFGWVCEKYKDKTEYSQVYVKFIFSNLLKDFYDSLPESSRGSLDREIDQLYRSTDFGSVKAIIDENIARLEETFAVNPQMSHREIEAVKQYIYDHYKEELSIDILARLVYMAPSYLSAVFKKETGQNLSKFIKEYRMEKARDMLENTHMKIVNISESVGYPNVSYFCQSFREFYGVSPQKFRNQGEDINGVDEEN